MNIGADIITIFPGMFDAVNYGVLGQAIKIHLYDIRVFNLRDFTEDRHKTTDDTPFGGGAGMVMLAAPIIKAVNSIDPSHEAFRILLTPRGNTFTQERALELVKKNRLLMLCGRYEGIDERVTGLFDTEISVGDFVMSGGEIGALAIIDAVARLAPGILGNSESTIEESFSSGLLEYPQYTRPREIIGQKVPEVLFSGDHAAIGRWRRGMALLETKRRRPDMFSRLTLSSDDIALLKKAEKEHCVLAREKGGCGETSDGID